MVTFNRDIPTEEIASPWKDLAEPLVARLSTRWMREDVAVRGLSQPNMRIFSLQFYPWVQRRQRLFRKGWWLRLTD